MKDRKTRGYRDESQRSDHRVARSRYHVVYQYEGWNVAGGR
jgi:hypothetical protein